MKMKRDRDGSEVSCCCSFVLLKVQRSKPESVVSGIITPSSGVPGPSTHYQGTSSDYSNQYRVACGRGTCTCYVLQYLLYLQQSTVYNADDTKDYSLDDTAFVSTLRNSLLSLHFALSNCQQTASSKPSQ